MTLQIIKSIDGKAEYVLLPFNVYNALRDEIEEALKKKYSGEDYVPFELADYVDNPVALARINADITQEELAKHMNVTQAYISKLEAQSKVTAKVLKKVKAAIEDNKK
ncbi:MAG: transcriptional regulator [Gammaproteobacteria bacterium RIFCSPHIGHO2_12_FULL_40_19]|nr:MAG: transcriptional regulator [Gammaproteobacteria bacterium RIFCSPHIGHO2_12_FULL_40_19]